MYKFVRHLLFLLPPEKAHSISMNIFKILCSNSLSKKLLSHLFCYNKAQKTSLKKINFKNIVGLGAGFDKNAKYLSVLETLGFGFVEVGTVTPKAQAGNPSPRLFRLPKDGALINRMGFNNDGVDAVAERLKKWKSKNSSLVVGGNIGKNKNTPNTNAWQDYEICFKSLHEFVDYFVVNVSSPNTPGLRELQEKESLKKILTHLQAINFTKQNPKPIFLKIAPDLNTNELNDVIDLTNEIKLDGLIVANTTLDRSSLKTNETRLTEIGNGGLSGTPLLKKNTEQISYIKQKVNKDTLIIASGGVFNASHAQQKINAGANLVQVWTGFVYEGPFIVKNILKNITT